MRFIPFNICNFINKVLAIFLVILSITLMYHYLKFPYLGNDDGYYLSILRDVNAGNLYFKDIAVVYNPLSIFTMGLSSFLFGVLKHEYALITNFFIILMSSFVLFKINKQFLNRSNAFLFSALFLSFTLYYDEGFLMLEPLTVLFQLISLLFFIRFRTLNSQRTILIAGFFLGLGFLSKQYAVFLLLPFFYVFLLLKNVKTILFFLAGLFFPILMLFGYYLCQDVSFYEFVNYILGKGVLFDKGLGSGYGRKINSFKKALEYILIHSYSVVILYQLFQKKNKSKNVIFYGLLAVSSFSVLYFADYKHYFQFVTPYLIIFLAFLFSENKEKNNELLLLFFMVISIASVSFYSRKTIQNRKQYATWQKNDIELVKNAIPEKSAVYLSGLTPAYYHLANLSSINLKKIGYSFPGAFYPKTIVGLMNRNAYLVMNTSSMKKYQPFIHLFTFHKKIELAFGDYYIYIKK